jgi:hypothetical protein
MYFKSFVIAIIGMIIRVSENVSNIPPQLILDNLDNAILSVIYS